MNKIKKGDLVIVLTGKDKGKQGLVTSVVSEQKILVEGVNLVKKHQKPNPNKGIEGGIVEKNMPIQVSNVAIYNSQTQKADRVGFKVLEDGKKVRFFKSNNEVLDA